VSLAHSLLVPVVALATLFVGVLEAASSDVPRAGVVRAQPCDLDAAALETSLDIEADADDDDSHDRVWHACAASLAIPDLSSGDRSLLAHANAVPRRPRLATAVIRGPPARG